MTDATIIIGLLILLTFNSVTSPFVETEQSDFFEKWYSIRLELETIDKTLSDCNLVESGIGSIIPPQGLVQQSRQGNPLTENNEKFSDPRYQNKEFRSDLSERCNSLLINKIELENQLSVLEKWGLDFFYLEIDGKEVVESKYSKELASGPFWVNMINLGMIFPFLFSAIIDSIFRLRAKEKSEEASRIGFVLMLIGFGCVVGGLSFIGLGFYNASAPFLEI